MGLSATALGRMVGLTAQEMNCFLKNQGFLEGEPGAYRPTVKGLRYFSEAHHHRGPGGDSWYNRDWDTQTWDESITDHLKVSDELIQNARDMVRAHRAELKAARAALPTYPDPTIPHAEIPKGDGRGAQVALAAAGVALAAIGIYKTAPHVRDWRKSKSRKDEKTTSREE